MGSVPPPDPPRPAPRSKNEPGYQKKPFKGAETIDPQCAKSAHSTIAAAGDHRPDQFMQLQNRFKDNCSDSNSRYSESNRNCRKTYDNYCRILIKAYSTKD
jgi:hypothetical protein